MFYLVPTLINIYFFLFEKLKQI